MKGHRAGGAFPGDGRSLPWATFTATPTDASGASLNAWTPRSRITLGVLGLESKSENLLK
jgi:hypothetical protein